MKNQLLFYLFSLLVLGLLLLMMFASFDYKNDGHLNSFHVLTHSDATLLYQFSKDFLQHPACINDWNFGTNFYIFPNLIIMLVMTFLFTNPSFALFSSAVSLFFLLIFSINFLFNKVFNGISKYSLIISNFMLSALIVYAIIIKDFVYITSNLFSPYHLGAFINSIIGLILILSYLKSKHLKNIIFLLVLSVIAIVSDRIFIVYFIIPVILTFLTILLFKKYQRRREYLIILLYVIISGCLGYLIHEFIVKWNILKLDRIPSAPNNTANSFKLFFQNLYIISTAHGINILIMSIALISIIFSTIISLRKLFINNQILSGKSENILVYFLFMFYFLIVVIPAPCIKGIYFDMSTLRYNIFPIYLALLNTGLLFEYFFVNVKNGLKYLAIISICLVLIYIAFLSINLNRLNPFSSIAKIRNYYPSLAKSADELSEKYHVKYGLGCYWDARFITVFSKQNVRVNIVKYPFDPVRYTCNSYYYYTDYIKKNPVVYNFVVLNCLDDTSRIYKIFDRQSIKKVKIDDNEFYLLPDFILKKDFQTFEPLHKVITN
jgi:hypothetical protein